MKCKAIATLFLIHCTGYIFGAALSDLDTRAAMNLYTQIVGTLNIDKSIEKGINNAELPELKKRIKKAESDLLVRNDNWRNPNFEQDTLMPLQDAFKFAQEKVENYHILFQALLQKENIEAANVWNEQRITELANLFNAKPTFAKKLYNELAKQADAQTLAAMAEFLKKADNDHVKALVLAIINPTTLFRLSQSSRMKLLVELIEQDIHDPTQFQFQRDRLGKIIKNISAKARKDSSTYPPSWINTVQWTAWGILKDKKRDEIYEQFRKIYNQKNGYPAKQDLEKILQDKKYLDEQTIKGFISELERYKYQLEYRPKSNITWGVTGLTDAARYQEHFEVSNKLIQLLRDIFPSIMSDLDDQLQLHGKYTPEDLIVLMQATGFEAVILGIIKETNELKKQYIQSEVGEKEENNGWEVL